MKIVSAVVLYASMAAAVAIIWVGVSAVYMGLLIHNEERDLRRERAKWMSTKDWWIEKRSRHNKKAILYSVRRGRARKRIAKEDKLSMDEWKAMKKYKAPYPEDFAGYKYTRV